MSGGCSYDPVHLGVISGLILYILGFLLSATCMHSSNIITGSIFLEGGVFLDVSGFPVTKDACWESVAAVGDMESEPASSCTGGSPS